MTTSRKESVIIVAGGKGLRMGTDLPKQFICLQGLPILMHTIQAFYRYNNAMEIILVLPLSHQDYWKELIEQYQFEIPHQVATGGETRFHSVKNGLKLTTNKSWIAIHDGVRPFATKTLIQRCFEEAIAYKAIIPAIPSKDSLRIVEINNNNRPIERSSARLIQTPQVFEYTLINNAYNTEYKVEFTDDASVVEYYGHPIHLTEGDDINIKITTPFDLKIGEILAENI